MQPDAHPTMSVLTWLDSFSDINKNVEKIKNSISLSAVRIRLLIYQRCLTYQQGRM